MRKFLINLFSNRFGIVLAALNLCYFVSKANQLMQHPLDAFFVSMNAPALVSSILSVQFVKLFLHEISFPETRSLANVFLTGFIVLQWLFIAWFANRLAAQIQKPKF